MPPHRTAHAAQPGIAPVLAALFVASGTTASPLNAQTLAGRVLEEGREMPVADASVRLIDREGERAAVTITDRAGRFRLSPPAEGEYYIEVERLGYRTTRSPLVALGVSGSVPIELMLVSEAVGLEGLEVTVEQEAEAYLGTYGVTPAALGPRWIDQDEVDAMETPGLPKDVIRHQNIAGIYIDEYDRSQEAPLCVRFVRRSRACAITVVDGIVVPPEQAFAIESRDIGAIAILDPLDATTFYGTQGGGGAVLIWTRAGGR